MGEARPRGTALKISLSLPLLARDPRVAGLLPEGAAELAVRLLQGAGLLEADPLSPVTQSWRWRVAAFVDRHLAPGQLLYVGLRKRFIEDEVRAALAEGAVQVLVLGAGYDTLGLRLATTCPGALFVEVDRPATLEMKRRGVRALGASPPNLRWLDVDLESTALDIALGRLGEWDARRLSVVVAEGLLMYLTPPAVSAVLEGVRRGVGPGSRLLLSYLRPDGQDRPYMGKIGALIRGSLRLTGEPLLWSVREDELPAFLGRHGFTIDPTPGRCDLRQRYLEPAGLGSQPLGSVERLAMARLATTSQALWRGRDPGSEGR